MALDSTTWRSRTGCRFRGTAHSKSVAAMDAFTAESRGWSMRKLLVICALLIIMAVTQVCPASDHSSADDGDEDDSRQRHNSQKVSKPEGSFDHTLTVISKWGRLTAPQDPTTITCLSAQHPPESLQFDRVLNTGQDSSLPQNKIESVEHVPQSGKVLVIPPSTDDKDRRFGAFSCQVTDNNVITQVVTLKQPSREQAEVAPRASYVRVNVNESAVIIMQRGTGRPGARLVWRHRGDKQTLNLDRLKFSYQMAKSKDAGIYELFYEHRRRYGLHGIARLIVRDCSPGKYGHMCEYSCPLCLNGGICHEKTGHCICPPGFGGSYCEQACGFNRFGPSCSWLCNPSPDPSGCAHYLFCLPDPYGCTCSSGFFGPDCTGVCPSGKFGPDCSETCRCAGGERCDPITGSCTQGCLLGWKGNSCQEPALGPVLELQYRRTRLPDQVRLVWKAPAEAQGEVVYTTERQLLQQLACGSPVTDENPIRQRTREPEIFLRDLLPHSVYEVSVFGSSTYTNGDTVTITVTTDAGAPSGKPTQVSVLSSSASEAEFIWLPIPCEERNGVVDTYEGELWLLPDVAPGASDLLHSTVPSLKALSQYTSPVRLESVETTMKYAQLSPYRSYMFRVRGRGAAGNGPWSELVTAHTEFPVPPAPQLMLLEKSAHTLTIGISTPDIPPRILQQIRLRGWPDHSGGAVTNVSNQVDATSPYLVALFNTSTEHAIHNYTLVRLQPFTMYTIQGQVATKNGWGNWSTLLTAWTDETYPSTPVVEIARVGTDFLQLQVERPNPANGIILQYRMRIAGPRAFGTPASMPVVSAPEELATLVYTVHHLIPLTRYQIQVQASTHVGWGNWTDPLEVWTEEGVPQQPAALVLLFFNATCLHVQWKPPEIVNGKLEGYEVVCVPQSSVDPDLNTRDLHNISVQVDSSTTSLILESLEPLTRYSVRVRARNTKHRGPKISRSFTTGMQTPPPIECFPDSATDTTVPVHFAAVKIIQATDRYYQIIVEDADNKEPIDESTLFSYDEAVALGLQYYVAAELNDTDVSDEGLLIYIGNNRQYGLYCNVPLHKDKDYYFQLRIILWDGKMNHTIFSPKTSQPLRVNSLSSAQESKSECLFYDHKCLWFPFVVIGSAVVLIWIVMAIIIYKCTSSRRRNKKVPPEKDHRSGSSSSIAWSVAYRTDKGYVTSHSEASTLVKDHVIL